MGGACHRTSCRHIGFPGCKGLLRTLVRRYTGGGVTPIVCCCLRGNRSVVDDLLHSFPISCAGRHADGYSVLDIGQCVDLFRFDLVPSNMVENGKVVGTTTWLACCVELCSVGHLLLDVCFVTHVGFSFKQQ